jgi:hypothetical protein
MDIMRARDNLHGQVGKTGYLPVLPLDRREPLARSAAKLAEVYWRADHTRDTAAAASYRTVRTSLPGTERRRPAIDQLSSQGDPCRCPGQALPRVRNRQMNDTDIPCLAVNISKSGSFSGVF